MLDLDLLDFAKGGGLVTVVAQDATTGDVLMVAFADRAALDATLRTGEMHYHSRTRGLWHKGGTSGNVQQVVSLTADCDHDAMLARVVPAGPACHTGAITCFTTARNRATTGRCVCGARCNDRSSRRESQAPMRRRATRARFSRPEPPPEEDWRGGSRTRPRLRG